MDDNVKNRTSLSAQYDPFIDGMFVQKGWVCPKCGRVYSPLTQECLYCNNQNAQSGATTTLDININSK